MTKVKPVHSRKAKLPIEVTEFGILTEVKPLQPLNAEEPIEVTELGIITEVNPVSASHRYDGMLVTVLPKLKVLILFKPLNGELVEVKLLQLAAFQFTVVM